jgi:hypothetical protein
MKIKVSLANVVPFKRKETAKPKPKPKPKTQTELYMEAVYTWEPDVDKTKWIKQTQQAIKETTTALNGPNAVEREKEVIMNLIEIYKYHYKILTAHSEEEFNRLHDELAPKQKRIQEMFKKLKEQK